MRPAPPRIPPGPPGLPIEERRSFSLWQVLVIAVVTLVIGMIIGYSGKKTSASSAGGAGTHSVFTLPPENATQGGSTTTVAGVAPGAPAASSSTTVAASTSRVATVLMPATKGKGTGDLPSFTTGGTYSFGWVFDCAENAGATGTFAVTVVPASGTAGPPAVTESGQSNQGVSNQPAVNGTEHLHVDAGPGCIWLIKVTGIAGSGG